MYVDRINKPKLKELAKTYENDKPITQPPDPATFATTKMATSVIAKEDREKFEKLFKRESLFESSLNKRNKEFETVVHASLRYRK